MTNLRTRLVRSISDIDPELWDSVPTGDPLHTHRFLRIVERSGLEGAVYAYALFYHGDQLVGTAAFSVFDVRLELFLGQPPWVRWVRRFWPRFLRPRIAFCGIPVSLAQRNVAWRPGYSTPVLQGVAEVLEHLAAEHHASVCMVKEFADAEQRSLRLLEDAGYVVVPSIPTTSLPIDWISMDAYLDSMRAPFRRQVRRAHHHLHIHGGHLCERRAEDVVLDDLYTAYLDVMDRSQAKLETLTRAFFDALMQEYATDLVILTVEIEEVPQAYAILLPNADELMFLLAAKHPERDALDSYPNLVADVVRYGIEHGYRRIRMGQTAYACKQRLGAVPSEMWFGFRVQRPLLHRLMSRYRQILFPFTPLNDLHVFRESEPAELQVLDAID